MLSMSEVKEHDHVNLDASDQARCLFNGPKATESTLMVNFRPIPVNRIVTNVVYC